MVTKNQLQLDSVTHLLFDWDGPIIDHNLQNAGNLAGGAYDFYWEALAKAIQTLGICGGCDVKRAELVQGFSREKHDTLFDYLHADHGVDFLEAMTLHHDILFNEYRDRYVIAPGIVESATELKKQYHLSVITHSNDQWIKNWEGEYPELRHLFSAHFYPKQYGYGNKRTGTEAYSYVCDTLGILPEQALIIEDSYSNLKYAKELGMQTLLINLYNDTKMEDADAVVYSSAELAEVLKK